MKKSRSLPKMILFTCKSLRDHPNITVANEILSKGCKEKRKMWCGCDGIRTPSNDRNFKKTTCARKRWPYFRDIRRAGATYGLQTWRRLCPSAFIYRSDVLAQKGSGETLAGPQTIYSQRLAPLCHAIDTLIWSIEKPLVYSAHCFRGYCCANYLESVVQWTKLGLPRTQSQIR